MNPLAAFQVLVLAMAAAMAVEAFKPSYSREWRIGLWVIFGILAVAGIATNQIAAAWPAASSFMAWAVSSPLTIFLAFIAWIIVLQRPWRRALASPPAESDDPTIEERLARFEALPVLDHKPPAYDDTALRAEIESLSADADAAMVALGEKLMGEIASLTRKVDGIAASHKAIIDDYQRMDAGQLNLGEQIDKLEEASDKVPAALHAIYMREILNKLADQIESDAANLYDPLHEGQNYDEARWLAWEKGYVRWESALKVWAHDGQWFAPDVEARTFTVDDALYSKKWTVKDSQFPDTEAMSRSEAVRRFKKFRILFTQWREVREEVDQGVIQVAFIGLSERDVRQRPPKVK